jgi:hypothetical protein
LNKISKNAIDLDALLVTLVGHPIGNKRAKASFAIEASSERVQTSIDKWKAEVKVGLAIQTQKADERWTPMMEKQDKKIELEASRVVVKEIK